MPGSMLNPQSTAVPEKNPEITRSYFLDREQVLHDNRKYWYLRRFLDIFFSAIGLIALAPLMLIVAVLIVIDSPGASPIFVQTRVGRDGKSFQSYKFRLMTPNAKKKMDNDLRPYGLFSA